MYDDDDGDDDDDDHLYCQIVLHVISYSYCFFFQHTFIPSRLMSFCFMLEARSNEGIAKKAEQCRRRESWLMISV